MIASPSLLGIFSDFETSQKLLTVQITKKCSQTFSSSTCMNHSLKPVGHVIGGKKTQGWMVNGTERKEKADITNLQR